MPRPPLVDPVPRLVEVEILGRPHLVLADAGRDDRVVEPAAVLEDLPQPVDGVLRQDGVVAVGVAQRLRLAPLLDLPQPLRELAGARAGATGPRPASYSGLARRLFTSPTIGRWATLFLLISDGSMSMWTILPCLANSRHLAGHAVVEAHAEGQQQVGLVDGVVGVDGAVHAEHLQAEEMLAGEAAEAEQRQRHGDAGAVGERLQVPAPRRWR